MADGWQRWFWGEGRLRALWRVLLFVVAFFLIWAVLSLLVPVPDAEAIPGDRLSPQLIVANALMLVAAVLAGWALLRWVDGLPPGALGFRLDSRLPAELGVGLLIGAGAIAVTVLALVALGAFRFSPEAGGATGWLAVAGTSLAAFAIPAAAEEALFRGYLFRALRDGVGPVLAVGLTSVLFALAHGSNPSVGGLALLNIFLAGVLLAVAVLRTGSLWFASALHLGWNWAMAGPLDLPVSGLESYDIPLYDLTGAGPSWLTGGAFGPEGGAAGTVAAALAITITLWITRPGALLAGAAEYGRHSDV